MEARQITPKQLAFIDKLASDRGMTNYDRDAITLMTTTEASELIEWLKGIEPKKSGQAVERGTYLFNGEMYMVKPSRTTGHLYATKIKPLGKRRVMKSYAPGIYKQLSPEMRVTIEQAANFGQCGVCCLCGRVLTDAQSIADGIGPTCKKRYF